MDIFCALNDFDVWNLRVGKQRPMFSLDVSVAVFASSSTVDCREVARKSWITLLIDCIANVRSDKASLKQSTAREKLQGSKALNAIHCEQAIIWLASCARPSWIGISQNTKTTPFHDMLQARTLATSFSISVTITLHDGAKPMRQTHGYLFNIPQGRRVQVSSEKVRCYRRYKKSKISCRLSLCCGTRHCYNDWCN